jgi:uncharacterized membrane protein
MKSLSFRRISPAPRIFSAMIWGAVCILGIAAPGFEAASCPEAARLCYGLFAPVCHQEASRAFLFWGFPCAVCHRCLGIYVGLLLFSLVPVEAAFFLDFPRRRRLWVLTAAVPLLVDALLPLTGIWNNSAATRFGTGFMFGIMLSSLLIPAAGELMGTAPRLRRRLAAGVPGGIK